VYLLYYLHLLKYLHYMVQYMSTLLSKYQYIPTAPKSTYLPVGIVMGNGK